MRQHQFDEQLSSVGSEQKYPRYTKILLPALKELAKQNSIRLTRETGLAKKKNEIEAELIMRGAILIDDITEKHLNTFYDLEEEGRRRGMYHSQKK